MRFAIRLTLALWLAIIVVLAVNGYDRFRREAALFESDIERDHRVMGRGIAAAVAEVWEDDGRVRALEILERANRREGDIQIRWVDLSAPAGSPDAPAAPPQALDGVATGASRSWKSDEPPGRIYTYVAIDVDGTWSGAIELSESLAAEAAYIRASMLRVALTTTSLAVLAGAIALTIGVVFVGRPIRRLVEKARRVGEGDFAEDADPLASDELGDLGREMNTMARRLGAARVAVEAETRSRLLALEQLRHAERLVTVGKLAAGVAHEVGTPLNVIAWRARNIAVGKVEGEAARENARVVVEQADRITRIVRQLLDYARRRAPDPRRTDLRAVVDAGVGLLAHAAAKAGVTVEVSGPPEPLHARVDTSQIQQVVTNLLLNAIQAMPDGGRARVTVERVRRAPPGRSEPGDWAAIAVEDEGGGIAPEHLPHLFDPFFTTKPVGEGTGLGLSVAWGIVQDHGGWVEAGARSPRGARFVVFLPAEVG